MKLLLPLLASTLFFLVISENDTNTDDQIFESGDVEMSSGGGSSADNIIFSGSGSDHDSLSSEGFDIIIGPIVSNPFGCETITSCDQPQVYSASSSDCYCDSLCELYRDCCHDYTHKDNSTDDNYDFDCVSVPVQIDEFEGIAILMYIKAISSCPTTWVHMDEMDMNISYCADNDNCPLVTDRSTKIVYKNIYYSLCHSASNVSILLQSSLVSGEKYAVSLSPDIHQCYPNDIISKCPSYEASNYFGSLSSDAYASYIMDKCSRFQRLVKANSDTYKNEYCALCHGHVNSALNCEIFLEIIGIQTRVHMEPDVLTKFEIFNMNIIGENYELPKFCSDNYVFDEVLEECRNIEFLTNSSANCNSTIALNDSEFEYAGDNMVLFRGELEEIQFNTSQGQPVICVNFTQNGTVNATKIIHIYPIGHDYITYVGCSLSIIGCCLVILTFSLFKDMRTLPTKILVNVCSTILANNSLIILTSSPASDFPKFCEAIAIVNHFFSLAQFTWMTVMCAEVMYTFYLASRLIQVDPKQNRKRFVIYCLISWLIPLLIVSICITLNYTTADIINYGRENGIGSSSCWINDFNSAVVVFLVPIATATLLQSIIFIIICALLCLSRRNKGKDSARDNNPPYFRILFALYVSSNIMWLFAFLALLIGSLWAWYPFAVLQSSQGLVLFLGFFGTKKVFLLYFSKLPHFSKYFSSSKSNKQIEV